jgi:DNA-binding transcriptional LysR family regulator
VVFIPAWKKRHFTGNLVVDDLILGVRAAIDGVGVLQVLPHYVAREIAEGRLVTVLENWAPPPVEGLHIYYPSRRQIRPALKVFVDFLRDAYRKHAVGQQVINAIPVDSAPLLAVPATLAPVLS